MEWIPNNQTVVAFLENHAIIIGMFLMLLRGISRVSSWTWDEKIVECLAEMFTIRKGYK